MAPLLIIICSILQWLFFSLVLSSDHSSICFPTRYNYFPSCQTDITFGHPFRIMCVVDLQIKRRLSTADVKSHSISLFSFVRLKFLQTLWNLFQPVAGEQRNKPKLSLQLGSRDVLWPWILQRRRLFYVYLSELRVRHTCLYWLAVIPRQFVPEILYTNMPDYIGYRITMWHFFIISKTMKNFELHSLRP